MTRDQRLAICKTCTNRQLDPQRGLICSVTLAQADFMGSCPDYEKDLAVSPSPSREIPLDSDDLQRRLSMNSYEKLRMEQNLPLGLLGAILAGVFAAILWAVITVITNFQIGFMAIAVGALVGFVLRKAGNGIDPIFGISGGLIAVLSCLLGNFLSIMGILANMEGVGYLDTLFLFDYNYLIPVMTESFSLIDLVFYGIAAVEGYKLSFRVITAKDLDNMPA